MTLGTFTIDPELFPPETVDTFLIELFLAYSRAFYRSVCAFKYSEVCQEAVSAGSKDRKHCRRVVQRKYQNVFPFIVDVIVAYDRRLK